MSKKAENKSRENPLIAELDPAIEMRGSKPCDTKSS